jgi:hypothetical protein
MDNGLIFPYHLTRAPAESELLREPLRGLPTHSEEASDGGTQEGRSSQAMVVLG